MSRIESLQNDAVKHLLRLRRKASLRRQEGLVIADGAREILRALEADCPPSRLWYCEDLLQSDEARGAFRLAREYGCPLQEVSEPVMVKLRYGDVGSGLVAEIPWRPALLASLQSGPNDLLLVVEGIEKPGNFGALLRSADGAGVSAVLLVDPRVEPANPNALRASTGIFFSMPIYQSTAEEALKWLSSNDFQMITLAPEATAPYHAAPCAGRVALVAGSEDQGLSARWRQANMDQRAIPMAGRADSLNLSVSLAIVLFDLVRRRSEA